jgi:hypothetical protein
MLKLRDGENLSLRHVSAGDVRRHQRKARTQDLDPMGVALDECSNSAAMLSPLETDG